MSRWLLGTKWLNILLLKRLFAYLRFPHFFSLGEIKKSNDNPGENPIREFFTSTYTDIWWWLWGRELHHVAPDVSRLVPGGCVTTSKIQLTCSTFTSKLKILISCDKEGQRFEHKVTEGSHTNLWGPSAPWGGTWWNWLWTNHDTETCYSSLLCEQMLTDRHLVIANRILQHMLETHTGCTASRLLLLLYQWNSRLPDPAWPAYLSRHFPVSMLHSRAEWSVRTAGRTGLVHWHLDSNQLLRWRQNTVSFTFLVQDIMRFPKWGAGTLRGHVVITGGQVKSRVGKFHWHVNVFCFFF